MGRNTFFATLWGSDLPVDAGVRVTYPSVKSFNKCPRSVFFGVLLDKYFHPG